MSLYGTRSEAMRGIIQLERNITNAGNNYSIAIFNGKIFNDWIFYLC